MALTSVRGPTRQPASRMATAEDAAIASGDRLTVLCLVLPVALLLLGASVGLLFTLDSRVAWERWLGLLVDGLLALAAYALVRGRARPLPLWIVWGMVGICIAATAWVVSASGPDVVRGPLGRAFEVLFHPLYGLATITDPVEVTNTRFIVGYNGAADLMLVVLACCGGLLLARTGRKHVVAALAVGAVAVLLLLATGSRGALAGLLVGSWLVGLLTWRYGWLLGVLAVPLMLILALTGVLDKGLELSSTTGRLQMWQDDTRLLLEYPLTGVGLGVDTADRVVLYSEINPDPERIAYAHNTFVQTYLEQGPLGFLGALSVLAVGAFSALALRRDQLPTGRRALALASLALAAAMEVHGLTDQVVTTNVGTALVLVPLALAVACLGSAGRQMLRRLTGWLAASIGTVVVIALVAFAVLPIGRAQALLNLGSLQVDAGLMGSSTLNQGQLVLGPPDKARLVAAEATLNAANALDPGHPAVLRELARAQTALFDVAGAMASAQPIPDSPRADAFDLLQTAHVYRDLGFGDDAYNLAVRAYAAWGRPPDEFVMLPYEQATLPDDYRVRTLADQGEAALHARSLQESLQDFQQALTFAPTSAYLKDRVRGVQIAIQREQAAQP